MLSEQYRSIMLASTANGLSTWGSKVAERYRLGDAKLLNADALKAYTKYGASQDMRDLDQAIAKGKEAARKVPRQHPDRLIIIYNVGQYLESRYKAKGSIHDLDAAVSYTLDLLESMPKGHVEYVKFTSNAAVQLRSRYDVAGRIEDLDLAVSKSEEVAMLISQDHADSAIVYHNWSAALSARYLLTRQSGDLDKCISTSRLVVYKLTTSNHPNRIKFLINLASCLRQRFDDHGALQDITDAIKAATEIVGLARPRHHPELATWLNYLALYHSKRFDISENIADADEAITYVKEAIEITPKDDIVNQAKRFSSLSLYYSDRYKILGDLNDLQLAVILSRKALTLFPSDHAERATIIHNLTSCLRARYLRLGSVEDLEEAIRKGQEAVNLSTAATKLDDLQRFQCNLSLDLYARFSRIGAETDLERAIQMVRSAIAADPDDFVLLNNLLLFLSNRWERHRRLEDLEEGIRVGHLAWRLAPMESEKRLIVMGNLAMSYRHRYESLHDLKDLEEAMRICHELRASPSRNSNPAHALTILSSCHKLRHEKLGLNEDLDAAASMREEALELMPKDHPDRATGLWSMILTRLAQFEVDSKDEHIDQAIREGTEAVDMPNATIYARIYAGYTAGAIAMHGKRWVEGSDLLSRAIYMMPKLTARTLTRDDQQFAMTKLINIASLAVSAALQADKSYEECLELLEAGRGIIASLTISSRNDVSDLDDIDPNIRLEYERLREKLNMIAPSATYVGESLQHNGDFSKPTRVNETKSIVSREDAIHDLEKLEERIRTLPGLSRFQLSPAATDLMELAAEGPIVSFNITIYRSDAFLVTHREVRVLQLPSLGYREGEANAVKILGRGKITNGKLRTKASRNKQLRKILQWMWDVAVGPVLKELGFLDPPSSGALPRIWWLTSGFLGSLPLHSAGYYGQGSTQNALFRVISSYIPSFKALAYARERRLKAVTKAEQRGLIVTMPKTVGMKDLDVQEEARSVQDILGQLTVHPPVVLETPTRQEVLRELPASTIVHFACHGASDAHNPSNGGLFLHRGSLTIRDLGPIALPRAQIAYLSACSTAENAALHLLEEGIQVATGFQLMGFPHVVGTLWEASNRAAVQVAKGFYRNLAARANEDSRLVEHGAVAGALHDAVIALMERDGIEDAIAWAPFIHIGA